MLETFLLWASKWALTRSKIDAYELFAFKAYVYILSSTDRRFRSIRTLHKGSIPEAEIEAWLTRTPSQDSTAQPQGNQCKRRKFKHLCFVYICPLNSYRVLNSFEEPCFTLVATITSLARELNSTGVGEYIYIYCHPQTDCFVLSELFIYIYIYI